VVSSGVSVREFLEASPSLFHFIFLLLWIGASSSFHCSFLGPFWFPPLFLRRLLIFSRIRVSPTPHSLLLSLITRTKPQWEVGLCIGRELVRLPQLVQLLVKVQSLPTRVEVRVREVVPRSHLLWVNLSQFLNLVWKLWASVLINPSRGRMPDFLSTFLLPRLTRECRPRNVGFQGTGVSLNNWVWVRRFHWNRVGLWGLGSRRRSASSTPSRTCTGRMRLMPYWMRYGTWNQSASARKCRTLRLMGPSDGVLLAPWLRAWPVTHALPSTLGIVTPCITTTR